MTTVKNPSVLFWKHRAQGIMTRENDSGEMVIIAWPDSLGSIPDQPTVDAWEAEFETNEKPRREAVKQLADADKGVASLLVDVIDNVPGLLQRLPQEAKARIANIKALKAKV